MTLNEFIQKWTGQPVDFDKIYPNQCMDLMHQYAYDVLNITDKAVLAEAWAALVYTDFHWPTYFDKIANTLTNVPQPGDIILWKEELNYDASVSHGYGHVAIFVSGDSKNFNSFDANWPLNSLPHIQSHNYTNVWGWLHPKAVQNTISIDAQKFTELVTKSSNCDTIATYFKFDATDTQMAQRVIDAYNAVVKERDGLKKTVDAQNSTITETNKKLTDANTAFTDIKSQLDKQTLNIQPQIDGAVAKTKVEYELQIAKIKNDMGIDCASEKKLLQTQIDELNKRPPTQIVKVETPLKDRFHGKAMAVKAPAALEVLFA